MIMFSCNGVHRQLVAGYIASISTFITGIFYGWAAPTLKKLREPDSPIQLTTYEETWVVNALHLAALFGSLPSGALMSRLGPKRFMLFLSMFPIISWVLVYFSRTAYMLIMAKTLGGLWVGGSLTTFPVYVGEIAEPQVRGAVGSFNMVNSYAGTIFIYLIAPYVSMPTMAIFCGAMPVIFLVLFSLCPESPYYYIMRGRHAEANETLTWLRGGASAETVQNELKIIERSIERETRERNGYFRQMLTLITVPANRKAFIIVEVLNFLQRSSGLSCLTAYTSIILPSHVGPLTSDHCTLLMGITWLTAALGCSVLVDRVGRKPLLYVSGFGIFISMITTGIWYYFDRETSVNVTCYNWIPLAGILLHAATLSLGLGPIAPTLKGEMFPSNLKGQAAALATISSACSSTISIALFATLTLHIGLYVNFIIFSALGLFTSIFTYYYVIETKGKTLQMIQDELRGDQSKKKTLQT